MAMRLTRSEDEARDIYQETFLRLYRTIGRFRSDCSLETYLYRIVSNICLDHLRRRAARPEVTEVEFAAGAAGREGLLGLPDPAPDHDPERAVAQGEIRRRIESALGDLAPRERLVFEMRHYEGMRLRAIGEAIGTTEETVKNCLFRAHQQLRAALGDLGGLKWMGARPGAEPAGVGA